MASSVCRNWVTALAIALLAGCLCGCGGGKRYEQYAPSEEAAQRALDAALAAWQKGEPTGKIQNTSPEVHVVDTHRRPGQRLKSYEILGARPDPGPRYYTVRLVLDQPSEETKVRFVIVGQNPLWVFRQEDYDMIAHWEHPMEPGSKESTKSADKK